MHLSFSSYFLYSFTYLQPPIHSEVGGGKAEASPLPDKHILQLIIDILQRSTPLTLYPLTLSPKLQPSVVINFFFFFKLSLLFGSLTPLSSFRRDTYEIFAEPVDPNEVCTTTLLPIHFHLKGSLFSIYSILFYRLRITIKSSKSPWISERCGLSFTKECTTILINSRFPSFSILVIVFHYP